MRGIWSPEYPIDDNGWSMNSCQYIDSIDTYYLQNISARASYLFEISQFHNQFAFTKTGQEKELTCWIIFVTGVNWSFRRWVGNRVCSPVRVRWPVRWVWSWKAVSYLIKCHKSRRSGPITGVELNMYRSIRSDRGRDLRPTVLSYLVTILIFNLHVVATKGRIR